MVYFSTFRHALIRSAVILSIMGGVAGIEGGDPCDSAKYRVAIDVGHDRTHFGTTSARGVPEFTFNQRLAGVLMSTLMKNGFRAAFLIGGSGGPISLKERVALANVAEADLFVSIHHDSVQPIYLSEWEYGGQTQRYSDRFAGFSVFVSGTNPRFEDGLRFSTLLADALIESGFTPTLHHAEKIEGESRLLLDETRGIYRWDGLAVARATKMPAVLIEAGVIVNRDEEKRLSTPEVQQEFSDSVLQAIKAFCAEDRAAD